MRWLNEPREWSGDASDLTVAVEPDTDFWRVTHYGFTRDSGHFLDTGALGLRFRGDFAHQYDQAGLMLRARRAALDQGGPGARRCAVAVASSSPTASRTGRSSRRRRPTPTAGGRSAPSAPATPSRSSCGDQPVRLAPFPDGGALQSGPMCAAPKGPGFTARFRAL